jgi:uncharacterized protein (TIGR04255 family)
MTEGKATAAPERKTYNRAPIVEAVIDIRVAYRNGERMFTRPECASTFKPLFPRSQPIFALSMGLSSGADGALTTTQKQETVGWRLSNESESRILQIQQQGFTYSHLPPYTKWEVFSHEVQPLWEKFVETCGPERITRVAMRYINLLKLPAGQIELQDYLHLYPQTPKGIEPLDGLLMQVRSKLPEVEDGGRFVITLAPAQSGSDPGITPFVLDLDVFCEKDLDLNDSELWTILQQLRNAKNRLFEALLTDRMKELIA